MRTEDRERFLTLLGFRAFQPDGYLGFRSDKKRR